MEIVEFVIGICVVVFSIAGAIFTFLYKFKRHGERISDLELKVDLNTEGDNKDREDLNNRVDSIDKKLGRMTTILELILQHDKIDIPPRLNI